MKPLRLSRTYINGILLLIIQILLFLPAIAQPANDACGSAISLTPGTSCTSIAGSLRSGALSSTATAGINAFCGNAASPDVWYSFVAQSTNPTIRLSGMGISMDNAPRLQIFNTTSCVVATLNANNNNCASGTNVATLNLTPATALTVGTTYLVRVFTNGISVAAGAAADWNFNICVIDPAPANDLCGTPVVLTSSTSCVNTTGSIYGSTLTAITITAPNCAAAATRDVWYRFVAQTTNPTITLSNIGSNFTNPGIQILSNTACGGTFTSFYCGTTSIAANFLTPGTTYLIRVFSTTAAAPTSGVNGGFDICIVDPVTTAANDECAGAVNLSVNFTCSNISSDMSGATPSATPLGGTCAGPNAYDIWFKFTAVGANETVTLGAIGANFLTPRIEIFSGNCGALTSIFCGVSPLAAAGLVPGNTYYVRVYSTTAPPPNGNARFNICVTSSDLPAVRFGNSYVNITKRTTGGVVEPGDILEIRMTIHHSAAATYTNLRFLDNVPTNTTMLTGAGDFIRVITNEGLTYKQLTPAAGDDAATYIASPVAGQFNIRMNLAFGTTHPGIPANNTSTEFASATGSMVNTDRPRGGGGLLFATAFRVQVTGAIGDTIVLNPSRFIYRVGGVDVTLTGNSYQILINDPLTLCTNSIGVNNASELGGTFGSGSTLNRATDLTVPISGYNFINNVNAYNTLGDGRYGLVKNMSPRSSTNRTANRQPTCGTLAFDDPNNCNNRMFGHWDIDGDHTGTANATGNNPPSDPTNSGYMLLVNADYVASEVYSQTLTNLCANTYYEFSAWFRNVCPTCGVDSVGAQFAGTVTAPAAGYPGVFPNLSFSLNGLDYYSTGEIDYGGGWVKKGFVFRTGPSQTSAVFAIRNNSQGGGGNDWALDDISVATCTPNLSLTPNGNAQVCYGNQVDMNCDVVSFFDNYTFYQWQVSHDLGVTWTDTLAMGTATPTLVSGNYEYNAQFPLFLADSGQHLVQYRIRVATSGPNLYNGCSFFNSANIIVMINNCMNVLKTDLLSFKATLVNKQARLNWKTNNETSPTYFEVQKSTNGNQFFTIGTVPAIDNQNSYSFTDPEMLNGLAYYRIIIKEPSAQKISNTESLHELVNSYGFISVENPFSNVLSFEFNVPQKVVATIVITDTYGKTLRTIKQPLEKGQNDVKVNGLGPLAKGTYFLQVITNEGMRTRRVVKGGK